MRPPATRRTRTRGAEVRRLLPTRAPAHRSRPTSRSSWAQTSHSRAEKDAALRGGAAAAPPFHRPTPPTRTNARRRGHVRTGMALMTAAPWPLQVAAAAQLRREVVCSSSGRTTDRDGGSGCGSRGGGSSVVAPPTAGRCPLPGGVGEMPTPRPRRADRTGGRAARATGITASSRCRPRRRPHPPRLGHTMAPSGAGSGAASAGATPPRRWQSRRLLAPAPLPPPAAHCGRGGALAA